MSPLKPALILLALTIGAASAAPGGVSQGEPAATAPDGRPYGPGMSCASVASLVRDRGAVVVSTGPYTYDRIVRDFGMCGIQETSEPDYVMTTDSRQCFAGYRCKDKVNTGDARN